MFSVGDKVVYPMHGAGQIEAVDAPDYTQKQDERDTESFGNRSSQ